MKLKRLINGALFCAIIFILTAFIKIPLPFSGYVNPGDVGVLLSGWLLPPGIAFLASAIGSSLADIMAGYVVYAPVTLLIKGLMAVTASYTYKLLSKKSAGILPFITGAVLAEVLMVSGYFIFEGFLYGFIPSAVNILPNTIQGLFAIVVALLMKKLTAKTK